VEEKEQLYYLPSKQVAKAELVKATIEKSKKGRTSTERGKEENIRLPAKKGGVKNSGARPKKVSTNFNRFMVLELREKKLTNGSKGAD